MEGRALLARTNQIKTPKTKMGGYLAAHFYLICSIYMEKLDVKDQAAWRTFPLDFFTLLGAPITMVPRAGAWAKATGKSRR